MRYFQTFTQNSKAPLNDSRRLIIYILFEVIFLLSFNQSLSKRCINFKLTNPVEGLTIPARTNRIYLEVLPPSDIEIFGFEEDVQLLDTHSIYFQEKISPNQLMIKLISRIQQNSQNLIPFSQSVDLSPILTQITLRNCDPEQKIMGNYKVFINSQVLDENTNEIQSQTIQSVDGSFYQQSEANKMHEHLIIQPSEIVKVQPDKFAILAVNQLDKQRILKYKNKLITNSLKDDGNIATITFTLKNSDYRKSHYCHFYLISSDGLQSTREFKIRGKFQGGSKLICQIPSDFNFVGTLYASIFINSQYYTNFIQLKSLEINDIISTDPQVIHGKQDFIDLTLDLPQTFGTSPQSLNLNIDGNFYEATSIEHLTGNITINSKEKIVRYLARIQTPYVNIPTYSSQIQFSYNGLEFYQSEYKLLYLPDIFIQEIKPMKLQVNQASQLMVLIKNINQQGRYWCKISTGMVREGHVQQSYDQQYNLMKDYLFCQLPVFESPQRIKLEILTNNGQYSIKSENFIEIVQQNDIQSLDDTFQYIQIQKVLMNNQPLTSSKALVYQNIQYQLSFQINQTLPGSFEFYCLFESQEVRYVTYLYQEQQMTKYSCSTPIIKDHLGELNITLINQENLKISSQIDQFKLYILKPIELEQKVISVNSKNQLQLKPISILDYETYKLFKNNITCLFNKKHQTVGIYDYSNQLFKCDIPDFISKSLYINFTVTILMNTLLYTMNDAQVISYNFDSIQSSSIKYDVLEYGDYLTIQELYLLRNFKEFYEYKCIFVFYGLDNENQFTSIFNSDTFQCQIPQEVMDKTQTEECYKLDMAVKITKTTDRSNEQMIKFENNLSFCNYPLTILSIQPKFVYVGDYNISTSQIVVQLNRELNNFYEYKCNINNRQTQTYLQKINQTHYACELDMNLKNDLYFIDNAIDNLALENQINKNDQQIELQNAFNFVNLIKQLPNVNLVKPAVINSFSQNQWGKIQFELTGIDENINLSNIELSVILNGIQSIQLDINDLNMVELSLSKQDIVTLNSYIDLQFKLKLDKQFYIQYTIGQIQIQILPKHELEDNSEDFIIFNSSYSEIPSNFIDTISQLKLLNINYQEIKIDRVIFKSKNQTILSRIINQGTTQDLVIQPIFSDKPEYLEYYELLFDFTYYKDPDNQVQNYHSQIFKRFMPTLQVKNTFISDNGKYLKLEFQNNVKDLEMYKQQIELKCLINDQLEVEFDMGNRVCQFDYNSQIKNLIKQNNDGSLEIYVKLQWKNITVSNSQKVDVLKINKVQIENKQIFWNFKSFKVSLVIDSSQSKLLENQNINELQLSSIIQELKQGYEPLDVLSVTILNNFDNSQVIGQTSILIEFKLSNQMIFDLSMQQPHQSHNKLSLKLSHTRVLFLDNDYYPFSTLITDIKLYNPIILKSIEYKMETENLYIHSINHMPKELFHEVYIMLYINDKQLNISCNSKTVDYHVEFSDMILTLTNFKQIILNQLEQGDIARLKEIYQVSVMFMIGDKEISLNKLQGDIKFYEQPFIVPNQTQNTKILIQQEQIYNTAFDNYGNFLNVSRQLAQYQNRSFDETHYQQQLLNQLSTNRFQDQSQSHKTQTENVNFTINEIQPQALLFNEKGFNYLIKLKLKDFNGFYDSQQDFYCQMKYIYDPPIKSRYTYFDSNSTVYCYFTFEVGVYFQSDQDIQVAHVQLANPSSTLVNQIPIVLIKDTNIKSQLKAAQNYTLNQNSDFQVIINGDFSFNQKYGIQSQCVFERIGSSIFTVINSTQGFCKIPRYPMKDTNITMIFLQDKDKLDNIDLPVFTIAFKRHHNELASSYRLFNQSIAQSNTNNYQQIPQVPQSFLSINESQIMHKPLQLICKSHNFIEVPQIKDVVFQFKLNQHLIQNTKTVFYVQIKTLEQSYYTNEFEYVLQNKVEIKDYYNFEYQVTITKQELQIISQILRNKTANSFQLYIINYERKTMVFTEILIQQSLRLINVASNTVIRHVDNSIVLNIDNLIADSDSLTIQCQNQTLNHDKIRYLNSSSILLFIDDSDILSSFQTLKCQIANSPLGVFQTFSLSINDKPSVKNVTAYELQYQTTSIHLTILKQIPYQFEKHFYCSLSTSQLENGVTASKVISLIQAEVDYDNLICNATYMGYEFMDLQVVLNYGVNMIQIYELKIQFTREIIQDNQTNVRDKYQMRILSIPSQVDGKNLFYVKYLNSYQQDQTAFYEQNQQKPQNVLYDILAFNKTQNLTSPDTIVNQKAFERNLTIDLISTNYLKSILEYRRNIEFSMPIYMTSANLTNQTILSYLALSNPEFYFNFTSSNDLQPSSSFAQVFGNLADYGRFIPLYKEFPSIKYFQGILNGVYSNDFYKFIPIQKLVTLPSISSTTLPMIETVSQLSEDSRYAHEIISLSTTFIETKRETYLIVQCDRYPSSSDIPIRLILRRIASTNIKKGQKYQDYFQIEPYQVHNTTHSTFKIEPGMASGVYEVSVSIKHRDSVNQFQMVVIRQAISESKLQYTMPTSRNLAQTFDGQINLTFSTNDLPLFSSIKSRISTLSDLRLLCRLYISPSKTLITQGQAIQIAQNEFVCNINLSSKANIVDFYPSQSYLPIILKIFARHNKYQEQEIISINQGFKLVKKPYLISLKQGSVILSGSNSVTLRFTMSNFLQDKTYCILSNNYGKVTVIDQISNFYMCSLTLEKYQYSQYLHLANNIDDPLSIDRINNSNIIQTSQQIHIVKSQFFVPDPIIDSQKIIIMQGQKQAFTISANQSSTEFYDYQSIPLTCRFYNINDLKTIAFQTNCQFFNPQLSQIQITLKQHSLNKGTYRMQLVVDGTFSSKIFDSITIEVYPNPWLIDIYPRYYLKQSTLTKHVMLVGRGYNEFLINEGILMCKMQYIMPSTGKVYVQSLDLKAKILSDQVIRCIIEEKHSNYLIGLRDTLNNVYFTMALYLDKQEIQLTKIQGQTPQALNTLQINLLYLEPTFISLSSSTQENDLKISSSKSNILREVSNSIYTVNYLCSFYQYGNHANLIAETTLSNINMDGSNSQIANFYCEMPQLSSMNAVTGVDKLEVVIHLVRTPLSQYIGALDPQKERISQNSLTINLIPQAKITRLEPQYVYNLAKIKYITVIGENFFNSQNLVCIFEGQIEGQKVKALYESPGKIQCPLTKISHITQTMQLSVSNDDGNTESNQLEGYIIKNLPNFKSLITPGQIFANTETDIVVQGTFLANLDRIAIKVIQNRLYDGEFYCNITVSDSSQAICHNVTLPRPGKYQVYIVPNRDSEQILKTNLVLESQEWVQKQYVPVPTIPLPSVTTALIMETPVVIQSLSVNLVTLNQIVLINGMNFKSTLDYYVTVQFRNEQLYFTKAVYINSNQLSWTFTNPIQSQTQSDCGQVKVRDSNGNFHQAVAKSHVRMTNLCYINDFQVQNLSLTEFPFSLSATNYHTTLYLTKETYENTILRNKTYNLITSIKLEYEGLGTQNCNSNQSHEYLVCGVQENSNQVITEVRLWININDQFRFSVNQVFRYYNYLTIDTVTPSTQIMQLVDKELIIQSQNLLNINTLSCIYLGSQIPKTVIQGIFISGTSMKCPLTSDTFDNKQIQVHITLNEKYFNQVNQTSTGKILTYQRSNQVAPDFQALHPQPNFNLNSLLNAQAAKEQAYQTALQLTLNNELNAIVIQAVDKTQILAGPWTNKIVLTLSGITNDIMLAQKLQCVLSYKFNAQDRVVVVSDSQQFNSVMNQMTCFFKKEIIRQGSFCLDLQIKDPITRTNTCQKLIQVVHIPTISVIQSTQLNTDSYIINTQLMGYYLNNWSNSWLCFNFYYSDELQMPFKIKYDQLPATVLQTGKKLKCQISDIMQFYSIIQEIEVQGITNIQDYFYDKSYKWKNRNIYPVFLQSHLVSIIDSNDPNLKPNFRQLYHPGALIGIQGYFLNNTKFTSIIKLTLASDSSITLFTSPCTVKSPTILTCILPLLYAQYGDYMISIYEQETNQQLSDANQLMITILPKPAIDKVSTTSYVSPISQFMKSQVYLINYKIKFTAGSSSNTLFLSTYKQQYLDQTICRVSNSHMIIKLNMTWVADDTLQCSFTNYYNYQPKCIEVSINNGKDYTSNCQAEIVSVRLPLADSFTPKQTLLLNSQIITISGKNFIAGQLYKCYFKPVTYNETKNQQDELISQQDYNQFVDAVFISSTLITCQVPLSKQNYTNELGVYLYSQGLLIKKFEELFTYLDYINLISNYPVRGSKKGGTLIIIKLENLPSTSEIGYIPKCKFSFNFMQTGTTFLVTATRLNQTHISCLSPNIVAYFNDIIDIYKDIYISVNNLDGTFPPQQSLLYTYLKDYQLISTTPTSSYIDQQITLRISGKNILNVHSLLLKLVVLQTGEVHYFKQGILWIDDSTLIMQMPSAKNWKFQQDRIVRLYLSLNDGVDWTTDDVTFTFYDDPLMTRLDKYTANLKGNVTVTIYGVNFRNDVNKCLFGATEVTPSFMSSTQIQCICPPSDKVQRVRIRVLVSDNYVIESSILTFYYVDATQINAIIPKEGYIDGGNTAKIVGNFSLFWYSDFDLYLGGILITDFVTKSETSIEFVVPPVTEPKDVDIKFVFDGLTYTNETIYYSYKIYSDLTAIDPNYGPTSGGTLIRVYGQRFDSQAYCFIDGTIIKPIIINSTLMICETPRHEEADNLKLELIFNENVYMTKSGLKYTYYNDLQINYLDPAFISMRAGSNQVRVYIYGNGFMNTSELMVRMNGDKFKPTFHSTKVISFLAPNVNQEGPYYVFVANNGQDFQRGSSNVVLTYYKLLGVFYLSHQKVQIGNDLIITVYGYNFPTSGKFYCVFGRPDIPPSIQYNNLATLNTTNQLTCSIPNYSGILSSFTVIDFRVSYNLQEYYGDLRLQYYPKLMITSFKNTQITQSQSMIVLTVDGSNFINTASELTCLLVVQNIKHKAFNILYQSSNQIICSFDMLDSGFYDLYISNNGLQYEKAIDQLEILDSIQVLNVEPKIILSTNTKQKIFVEANNLLPESACFFEVINSDYKVVVKQRDIINGILFNSNMLICNTPDYSQMGTVDVQMRISYGEDALKTQSNSFVELKFVDRCPPGYSCRDNRIIPCPKGHFCIGGSQTRYPRPCPIGYYQDKSQSNYCKGCSKGYLCPFAGMEEPIICPEGFICSREKLNSPNQQCSKGSYCFKGTMSEDITELNLYLNLPYKGQPGSYCRQGMKTGVVTFNANSSTPSPCKQGMICFEGAQDVGGSASCPTGYYCPFQNSTGIICPPRHFCPDRGNLFPIPCPKGTFNIHYGQKNCTQCTLGRFCPQKGLFLPIICPPGYVCNKEGLVLPDNLCKAGHICLGGVMSATSVKGRSCYMAVKVGDNLVCQYGKLYSSLSNVPNSAHKFYNYFYEIDVCCMNGTEVSNYVAAIGKNFGMEKEFLSYAYVVNTTGAGEGVNFKHLWDGMRIVDKAAFNTGLNISDKLTVPVAKHRNILVNYFHLMYTNYQQRICPGGYLCLEGVYTYEADKYLISTPFPCPIGSYCLKGSDSVIGTGLCPIGFFCVAQTEFPKEAEEGFYTGNQGAVEAQQCQPGTFALGTKSAACTQCPNGYECKDKGTSTPTICPTGYYRSITESNVCSACPRGTFSFERGIRDQLECLECPPGRICENEAYKNITSSIPCTDGQVCESGSGAKQTSLCPEGFFCPTETNTYTQFENQCEAGFFCRSGTGEATKTRDTCPQTFFCPKGTGLLNILVDSSNYQTWATDPLTRCPEGTGYDGQDTKTQIEECFIDSELKLLVGDLDIRIDTTTQSDNTPTDSSSNRRMLSQELPSQQTSKRRNLEVNIYTKDNPILKDLYEIDYILGDYYDQGATFSPWEDFINFHREYIARICPLNITLVSEYVEIEELTIEALETNVPNVIFELPPSAYALITIDFRHMRDEDLDWTYGEDYQIAFTMDPDLTIEDESFPISMPEQFLYNETDKSAVLEFMVFALDRVKMRIDILLYNSLFLNYRHLFVNSTSVEIRYPNRADFGTQNTFIASIVNEYDISLPLNIPKQMPDKESFPTNLVSFAYSQSSWDPIRHRQTKNRNIWIPSSLYWNDRDRINLPYLPFLSNCKGFGKFIPFWALMEQNYQCSLIPQNETVWMTEYSFGLKPTADTCDAVEIDCMYDEIFNTNQPLQRWFEVQAETPLFDITVDPKLFADMVGADFDSTQVLSVFPMFEGDFTGLIPKQVQWTVSYYQIDESLKRIIINELVYDQFEELTDEEAEGAQKVNYKFTFSFQPLSHKDLTINFAFGWDFYVVLYLIVGMIAVFDVLFFMIYHRLIIRPPPGKKLAQFKFVSYIQLTIPPAFYGIMLAMIPVTAGNFFISAFMVAHIFQMDTSLYPCTNPGGVSKCVMTLFDNIKDDPYNVEVDYQSLRVGRCGTCFLVMGAYILYVGLTILIPNKANLNKVPEAYDGNVWEFYTWKRSNMIFISTFLLFFELTVIQFSFSPSFGDNIWFMIGLMKVVQIVVENMIERSLSEALLVSPLSVSIGVMQGLITFGASNFLDFLNGFFIEVGIQMFERPYLEPIVKVIQEYLEERIPVVYRSLVKWFRNEDELADRKLSSEELAAREARDKKREQEEEQNEVNKTNASMQQEGGEEEQEAKKKEKLMFEGDSQESSRSEIYYSEDSSYRSRNDDDGFEDNPNAYLLNQNDMNDSEIASIDLSKEIKEMKIKIRKKKDMAKEDYIEKNAVPEDQENEDEFEDFNDFQDRKNDSANESDIKLDQDVEAQLVEPLLECHVGYANDTLSCLYQPFFTALLWIFYDETVVANLYGIKIQDFIYYFLFNIVIIPFQIVIDIFFYNILEWYNDLPVHDYLDYLSYRFKTRKTRWKGNESTTNTHIAEALRSLDQLCFSSQYFFVVTLYVSGITQILLGIQILLWEKQYNIFGDYGTLPLIGFMFSLCIVTHRVCLQMGKVLKIWRIDETMEKLEKKDDDQSIALQFQRILEPEKYNKLVGKDTPGEVKFDHKKWRLIDRIKLDEETNKNDLLTDRMVANTFREMFMKYNKPWIQEQMYEVFTPRTLFMYRKDIIDQFKKVLGPVDANVSLDSEGSEDSQKDNTDSLLLNSAEFEKQVFKKKKKFVPTQEEIDWVQANNIPTTRAIIRFWILRARMKQKVRIQVNKLIESQIQKQCMFCRATYGLKAELIQNIEDLFFQFLKQKKQDLVGYDLTSWQQYFVKHGSIRTICIDCSTAIEKFHLRVRKELKKKEDQQLEKLNGKKPKKLRTLSDDEEDDEESEFMKGGGLEKRKERIRNIGEGAKFVIKQFMLKARKRLKNPNRPKLYDGSILVEQQRSIQDNKFKETLKNRDINTELWDDKYNSQDEKLESNSFSEDDKIEATNSFE